MGTRCGSGDCILDCGVAEMKIDIQVAELIAVIREICVPPKQAAAETESGYLDSLKKWGTLPPDMELIDGIAVAKSGSKSPPIDYIGGADDPGGT